MNDLIDYNKEIGEINIKSINKFKKIIISVVKGGVISIKTNKNEFYNDFGWSLKSRNKCYTSNYFSRDWKVEIDKEKKSIYIKGNLLLKRNFKSTISKHLIIRILSFLNIKIIPILKKLLIFKNSNSKIEFERNISINKNVIIIEDKLINIYKKYELIENIGYSERHTASANSFNILLFQKKESNKILLKKYFENNSIRILKKIYDF